MAWFDGSSTVVLAASALSAVAVREPGRAAMVVSGCVLLRRRMLTAASRQDDVSGGHRKI